MVNSQCPHCVDRTAVCGRHYFKERVFISAKSGLSGSNAHSGTAVIVFYHLCIESHTGVLNQTNQLILDGAVGVTLIYGILKFIGT